MKVVIRDTCDGTYFDSHMAPEVASRYKELKGETLDPSNVNRDDPALVQVAEELNGRCHLKVVDVPEGVEWRVDCYHGEEWVTEILKLPRTWR